MNSKERTLALSNLAVQIAATLNAEHTKARPWTFVEPGEDTYSVYLRNAGKGRIYLSLTSSKGYDLNDRLSITGSLNIGKNNQYVEVRDSNYKRISAGEITVAVSRGVNVIAQEIAKRFLPHYLEVLELAERKLDKEQAYNACITDNLTRIAKIAGARINTNTEGVARNAWVTLRGVHTDITVYEEECSLKLDNLTFEKAEYILRYLKGE